MFDSRFTRNAVLGCAAGFVTLSGLAGTAQGVPAAPVEEAPAKVLVDPAVVAKADGRIRPGVLAGTTEAYLPILFPSSHAANLLQLKNGDLLCVWFSGVWEGNSGVGTVIARLPKGAKAWQKTMLIDSHEGESYQNPVVYEAPNGDVHLFHTTQGAGAGEANAHVLHVVSKDHGASWGATQLLFDKPGSFTRHPLLTLKDGTWVLPLTYVTSRGIGEGAETNYSSVKLSKDSGATWTECLIPGSQGKVQPTLVTPDDKGFVVFYRDRASNHIYRSTSDDACHWTAPAATVLPNNNASVQAFRLKNGHIVMAFDNSAADRSGAKPVGGLRKPLSVAVSEDEGLTWTAVRDIETGRPGYGAKEGSAKTPGREEYSYPSIMQLADGRLMIAYTYRRQTIKVVTFTEAWLRQGGTAGLYKP